MKKVPKAAFFIVAILIIGMAFLSIFGIENSYGDIVKFSLKGAMQMRTGIDIRGGVEATFQPATGEVPSREDVDAAKQILELRLDANNITDREVYPDYTNGRIVVRFPWKSDEVDFDPEAAIEELAASAILTFVGPDGETVLTGSTDVDSASVGYSEDDGYVVLLNLTQEGRNKFKEATEAYQGQTISIMMDEQVISSPTVNKVIDSDSATITGNFTVEEAQELADTINAGSLPFKLEATNYSTISPTLGEGSLDVMVNASVVAFILVCLFMLLYYRVPGLVACITLVGQIAGALLAVSIPQFTLTLPGIAGIVLSIGMGVDANIITAERIKEEIHAGRTISGSIDAGYKNAWSAILDGNVTMLIVAVILYTMGSGSVRSFGYTLAAGIVFNFIMGVWAAQLMQKGLARFKAMRNPWLYGGKRNEND